MSEVQSTDDFRAQLREWLEVNCPPEMRGGGATEEGICWGGKNWVFTSDAQKAWLDSCSSKGYTVPTWPVEYGGAGLTRDQEKIFHEEMNRIDARSPLQSFGIWMLGP
ncbi:MAG: acyl-CoA dehydrogenase family protein, partial [Sulfitobacter sp.]